MFGDFLGGVVDAVTSPLRLSLDVLEGLSEGELRTRAIAQLGASAVAGLDAAEIIELMLED